MDAHRRLSDYPFDCLMLAPQTAVVPLPQLRAERAQRAEVVAIGPSPTLGDYFARMCHSIAHVCANPFTNCTRSSTAREPRELGCSVTTNVSLLSAPVGSE